MGERKNEEAAANWRFDETERLTNFPLEALPCLIDWLEHPVLCIDEKLQINFINRRGCEEFQYPANEALEASCTSLLFVSENLDLANIFRRTLLAASKEQAEPETVRCLGLRRDGSTFPVLLRIHRLDTSSRLLLGIICRNLAPENAAEERLRKLSRAIDQLGSTVVMTDMAVGPAS